LLLRPLKELQEKNEEVLMNWIRYNFFL
jgi:hypothetical protein